MSNENPATRDYHPARHIKPDSGNAKRRVALSRRIDIPSDTNETDIELGTRVVHLTNLKKIFWPKLRLTKRDLLQYYANMSPLIIPHIAGRAMVMKRYPNGVDKDFFFMKRAPTPRPEWIEICSILHTSDNVIDFPIIDDLATLLWVVNLGCVDLNQWYARCDDVDRPDYLHFDLDPVPGASFQKVLEVALLLRSVLDALEIRSYAKTTGGSGIHVYVPIKRGPTQKQVWRFTKELAQLLASQNPKLVTAEYQIAKRPRGTVLVDYNQNAWGRTLASIYSVRPRPKATVSTPVTWKEIEDGIKIDDFTIHNVPARVSKLGDLWAPLLKARGRFDVGRFVKS